MGTAQEVKLGEIIETEVARDAIHIAVAPVIAATELVPGTHVGFVQYSNTHVAKCDTPIGIVDPFLQRLVYPEEKFWLFLYQNSITSLRHDWDHPAFCEKLVIENCHIYGAEYPDKTASRQWITEFAQLLEKDYDTLMADAKLWIEHGDYTYDNSELYKEHWSKFEEFWKHYAIVTGLRVTELPCESFYTCSC